MKQGSYIHTFIHHTTPDSPPPILLSYALHGMKKLWGGAFAEGTSDLVERYGQSIDSDLNFWQEDIIGSVAHARMLGETGIISFEESRTLIDGLEKIHEEGPDSLSTEVEDIHTAIEVRLRELVGDVAGKLHTARSRNDQVATDTRLYVHNRLIELQDSVKELQEVLLEEAAKHTSTIMPGYTHQQRAQPITLGFYLMAHFWSLQRHGWRMERLMELANYSPLGAAALAGSGFPIDRVSTAQELGFTAPIPNALDATSDRSYLMDALHVCAMLMIDLSRISQDLILFSTKEFGFVHLGDDVTTGSSIMPQKRNPDMAELIRGRTGRAIAHWVQLASVMKGLPLGYNRDTQEDKPPLFSSFRLSLDSMELVRLMLCSATWDVSRMRAAVTGDFSTATDLADFLAARGVPFREAHDLIGRLVRGCVERGCSLEDLTPSVLAEICPEIPAEGLGVLRPEDSVARRESLGGPGPKAMEAQMEHARRLFGSVGFAAIA